MALSIKKHYEYQNTEKKCNNNIQLTATKLSQTNMIYAIGNLSSQSYPVHVLHNCKQNILFKTGVFPDLSNTYYKFTEKT